MTFLKPLLVGEDPLDIGRHWRRMSNLSHFVSPISVGTVDVALWDIAGKAAGLPVHRLLGTCRDRIPAYFSSGHHATAADYADEARYWQDQGWQGYKLHPPRAPWVDKPAPPVAFDIEACAAVRSAVGPDDDVDARLVLELLLLGGAGGRPRDRGARLRVVRGSARRA